MMRSILHTLDMSIRVLLISVTSMTFQFSRLHRSTALGIVAALLALIAVADWKVNAEVPVGFLYLLPIVFASRYLGRFQISILAAICATLAEQFDGLRWSLMSGLPRDFLYFAAFIGVGLFAHEVGASRRLAVAHVEQLEHENQARRDAEEQLEVLVQSSPVAILTADANCSVLLANDAAHRLFALPPGQLPGQSVRTYLPSLAGLPDLRTGQQSFRTVMQCKGHRSDGEIFIADVWFSTYRTGAGPRLAAMVVDTSEELRDREEVSLHRLLAGSRILVSAVSHEIRNICGAIALVHENLARSGALAQNADFEALGTLVIGLEKIAAMELGLSREQGVSTELSSFFDELAIVNGPSFKEKGIAVEWNIPADLPQVWADPHSLMQVFLNLIKNSERALDERPDPRIHISATGDTHRVRIAFADNGGGIQNPELLFKPFQQNAKATGLGLYLSRALMRSFGGDLRYQHERAGALFVIEIDRVKSDADLGYGEH